jgi:hypothetical protein
MDGRVETRSPTLEEIVGAAGPNPEHADALMLFGQFVGSWDVESTGFSPDGRTRSVRGEWHFFWALEGRAIQDVIISPPRGERDAAKWNVGDYQTAIRFYRPADGSWDVTAISPPYDQVHRLVARKREDRIVLEGTGPDGRREIWSFYEITADRCRWRGQISDDGGRTWFTDEEMVLTRRRA